MTPPTKLERRQKHIIDMMQFWDRKFGEPPKVSDWRRVGGTAWPSYLTVIRAFGSWDEAMRRAGFEARGRGRRRGC